MACGAAHPMISWEKKTEIHQIHQRSTGSGRTALPVAKIYDRCRTELQKLLTIASIFWRKNPTVQLCDYAESSSDSKEDKATAEGDWFCRDGSDLSFGLRERVSWPLRQYWHPQTTRNVPLLALYEKYTVVVTWDPTVKKKRCATEPHDERLFFDKDVIDYLIATYKTEDILAMTIMELVS